MPDDARDHGHDHHAQATPRRAAQTLRQDRFEPPEWSCRVVIGGRELAVCNYSAFGLAVLSSGPVETDDASAAPLLLRDIEVARVRLRRVRVEARADGRCKTAFAIVGAPLDLNRIDAIGRAHDAIDEQQRSVARTAGVPAPFKLEVYQLRDALERLEQLVGRLGAAAPPGNAEELRQFEASVAEVLAVHLDGLFSSAYDELGAVVSSFGGDDARKCHDFFREQLRHLLYQSPIFDRTYTKPLGYAGDYEMLNLIYRNENLGKTLFARCLSRYCLDHANGRAVRNRPVYLAARMRQLLAARPGERLRILSVSSGPARELQLLVDDDAFDVDRVELELFDQDATALRHAQGELRRIAHARGRDLRVRLVQKAMSNLVKGALDGRYDFIYSAGLFDYFSDPLARRAATRLYRLLDAGGELVIGNFKAVPQNRAFMELALDWELIYRTEEDLRALYAGIAPRVDIDAEAEQINLFVTLRR